MKTLFIDFDGTICTDRFWRSHPEYAVIQEALFIAHSQKVADWMRGQYSSEEINQFVSEQTGIPYKELWNIFTQDCESAHVPATILEICFELQNKFQVVLITGNMDCFSRFTMPALRLEKYFNKIVNSFDEKQLKTDNAGESFLKYCSGDLTKAVLIEDSQKSIDVFRELGGTAYQTDSLEKTLEILQIFK
jgi:beta-phosphoglucomutase-like phosphatase (HAD superfamily)